MAKTYSVYRDNVKIAEGLTEKQYTDSPLQPDTEYKYKVSVTEGGQEAFSDEITVRTDPATRMAPMSLALGGTETLLDYSDRGQGVTFESSDPEVVSVTKKAGKATGVAEGTAVITRTDPDGSTEDIPIIVEVEG